MRLGHEPNAAFGLNATRTLASQRRAHTSSGVPRRKQSPWPPSARRPQRTRTRRPPACDRLPPRSCIRGEQQRRADCSLSMRWALAASVLAATTRCCFCLAARIEVARERSAALCARRWRFGGGRTAPAEEQPRCRIRRPRRGHVRAAARCRRPPSLTRHAAGVPRRPAAAQQGDALPGRPADDRGDRHRDAPRRRRRPRPPAARPDRRAVARRPAHPRGARARRGRPGPAPRLAAGAARQGRPPPRGRHGRLGLGAA